MPLMYAPLPSKRRASYYDLPTLLWTSIANLSVSLVFDTDVVITDLEANTFEALKQHDLLVATSIFSNGVLETAVSARGSLETGFSKSRLETFLQMCRSRLGLGTHCLGLGSVSDPTVSGAGQLFTWSYGQL